MNIAEIVTLAFQDFGRSIGRGVSVFLDWWYIILPPLLYPLWKLLWMDHIQNRYAASLEHVLLEIIPPREIERSPKPMESVFSGLYGVVRGLNTVETYVDGALPEKFSFEIASDVNGLVHFYLRTTRKNRSTAESYFYSQYPDLEFLEVPDYVDSVPRYLPNNEWELFGTDFVLAKDDLYPIKTYRYFEEEVTGKMIDPLAGIIESFGKLPPGQMMWLQIIATPHPESWYSTGQQAIDKFLGTAAPKKKGMIEAFLGSFADVFINVIRGLFGMLPTAAESAAEKRNDQPVEFRLTPGQKETLKALESNLGKLMFRVKMRFIYLGKRGGFDKSNIAAMSGGLKQFTDQNLNAFKMGRTKTKVEYLFVEKRLRFLQRRIFRRYRERSGDPSRETFLLSTEELATIFHMPDMTVVAPSLTRVSARRAGAPSNLPILEED